MSNKKKEQLGMAQGTARNKLVKMLMFDMSCKLGLNICFQCGTEINNINEFSIEHKKPWLNSNDPKGLYFDLNNISFSHQSCNVGAARPRKVKHPSRTAYKQGCRCEKCREINTKYISRYRSKK